MTGDNTLTMEKHCRLLAFKTSDLYVCVQSNQVFVHLRFRRVRSPPRGSSGILMLFCMRQPGSNGSVTSFNISILAINIFCCTACYWLKVSSLLHLLPVTSQHFTGHTPDLASRILCWKWSSEVLQGTEPCLQSRWLQAQRGHHRLHVLHSLFNQQTES